MFEQPANEAPTLDDYLRAIQARKWLVLTATALGVLLALTYHSARSPEYEAVTRVVVGPSRSLSLDSARAVAPNLERERELMLSDDVFASAAATLGISVPAMNDLTDDDVEVDFIPDSDVLRIAAVNSSASLAADLANAIATSYVAETEAREIDFFTVRIDSLEAERTAISDEIAQLDQRLSELESERQTVAALPATDPTKATQLSAIDADRSIAQTNRQQLIVSQRSAEADLRELRTDLNTRAPSAELISPARLPEAVQGLSRNMLLTAGTLLGLTLGVAAAFILARLDRRARNQSDIESALGQRVLSSIPSFGFGFADSKGEAALVMMDTSHSAKATRAAEAFRRLRTSVGFLANTGDSQTFLLSSAFPGEGKSTVCANLGLAFAQGGKQTVIVSADLRRPTLERLFGIEAEAGLSQWLGGDDDVELLVDLPQHEGLYMVPAGPPAMNSSELLGSDRFDVLIKELEGTFDVVLVDSPPVLATADTGAASKHVDGVVIVVDSRRTETDQLAQVRADLDRAGSTLLGAVLNRERQRRALPWRKRDRYSYAYAS